MDGNYAPSPSDMRIVATYRIYCAILAFTSLLELALWLLLPKPITLLPEIIACVIAIFCGIRAWTLLKDPCNQAFWMTVVTLGVIAASSAYTIVLYGFSGRILSTVVWGGACLYAFTPKARRALSGDGPRGGLRKKIKSWVAATKAAFTPSLTPQPVPTACAATK